MKKLKLEWTVKQFFGQLKKGAVSFNYPIQRAGGQWDLLQKSVLIHSLTGDYPVPPLYAIAEDEITEVNGKDKKKTTYFVLDGKQRLTNIRDFVEGVYALHADTPSVEIDGETFELGGKWYDELEQVTKDAIQDFGLLIYKLEDATDEEIEEVFYRLNNGTPLSKQQKAKAKMGTEWAMKIQELVQHDLMKEKTSFTELQIRKADDETALLQTMMIMDENYDWKNISSNEVFDYAQTFRDDMTKDKLVSEVANIMDYLDKAFEDKEATLLKKVHFPMTLLTARKAMALDIHPTRFSDWKEEFKLALKRKSEYTTNYKNFGGAGSVKKEKTNGRVNAMHAHLDAYFKNNTTEAIFGTPVEVPAEKKVTAPVEPKPKAEPKSKVEKKAEPKQKAEPKADPKVEVKEEVKTEQTV